MRVIVVFVKDGREIGEVIAMYNRISNKREVNEVARDIAEDRRSEGYQFDYYKVYTEV